MTASTGLGHPSGPCAGLPTRVVPFSTTAPFNHGSEVPETAGLRPANYGEETLPTIGNVEGKQETSSETKPEQPLAPEQTGNGFSPAPAKR
jgi:hypothetical protein